MLQHTMQVCCSLLLKMEAAANEVFPSCLPLFGSSGADPAGGPGGQAPPPFGGPPNSIKMEKNVVHVRAKTPHFST